MPLQRSALARPTRRPCIASVLAVRVALVWRAAGRLVPAGRPAPVSVARSRRRPTLPRHPRRDATSGPAAPGAAARPRATGRVGGYGPGRVRSSTALSGWQAGNPPESPRAPGRTGSATGHRLPPRGAPGPAGTRTASACPGARSPDCWRPPPARALDPGQCPGPPARRSPPVPSLPGTRVRVTVALGPGCGHLRGRRFPSVPHHRGEVALRFRGQSSGQLIVVRRPGRG